MQINENLYFDINIEGYGNVDFVSPTDLCDFQIIETAGTSLPIFYVAMVSSDKTMLNRITNRNKIIIKLGETRETADTFTVQLYVKTPPNTSGQGAKSLVEFGGYITNIDYMINQENRTYWGNSLLVTRRVLQDYLGAREGKGFITDIKRTNENQVRWMRNLKTACTFLAETLVHMDIMPSFPLFAFDKYGNFHLRDFDQAVKDVVKNGTKYSFVAKPPQKSNEIQYINSFNVEDFSDSYNLYSGFNKVTEIWGIKKGVVEYEKSYNVPTLAATKQTEMIESSSRATINTQQSSNVHDTYVSSFVHNTNKLVALSSMCGAIELAGKYYKDIVPTDIVNVSTAGEEDVLNGLYIVDTVRTRIDMSNGGVLRTYVYVTRDNKNNVENYIANQQKGIKIRKRLFTDLLNAIGRVRVAYATGKKIVDGTFMKQVMSFALITKRNLLRSFNVAGVAIDFNSSANLIRSLISAGNSLMNSLTSMIFPENIAGIFRDFIIRKPTLKTLLYNYVAIYVPAEVRDLITSLLDSIFDTTDTLNSIAKDNNITVSAGSISGSSDTKDGSHVLTTEEGEIVINADTSEIDYVTDSQEKVGGIIKDFENNTTGLNIPFPIITLTESQALMPEDAMRNYIADQTILNLTNLGYLNGVDTDKLKDILLGKEEVDFVLINQINTNAGNTYNYKFWGTYNDLVELTNFYIKKCYKDNYRTIPCTKLVNATGNTKIFFACPTKEQDLRFYINSTRIDLVDNPDDTNYEKKLVIGHFPINLGYTDIYGNPIEYTVYYTNKGFNSNSVLFEVKQGGMV